MVVSKAKILACRRGYRRARLDVLEQPIPSLERRRCPLGGMVMMVMVTSQNHVSIMLTSGVWTRRVLMMMMVSTGLCALRAARGRAAACAILVGFAFVVLSLPTLAARSRLCRRLRRMFSGVVIFACQSCVRVCDLGAAGYWTGGADAAYAAP